MGECNNVINCVSNYKMLQIYNLRDDLH